jgi:hypothetical protein
MELPDDTRAKIEAEINGLDRWTYPPVNFIGDALKMGAATALRQLMDDFSLHLWESREEEGRYRISVCLAEDTWAEFILEEAVMDGCDGREDMQRRAAELRRLADLVDSKRESLPPFRKRHWVYEDEEATS